MLGLRAFSQSFTVVITLKIPIYLLFRCISIVLIDGSRPNGTISVLNACRLKAPDGELNIVEGYAFRPDESEPGKLSVVFPSENFFGRLFGGGANCK